jgi:two-component system, OmpR family, phosphate regulon response regulator PhoB
MNRVLIVDDDPDILVLLSYHMQQEGYEPLRAGTGRQALEIVSQENPDLIILDLMLPDLDGIEVCRNLRLGENSRNIPVIMLTARAEEADRVMGLETGADDYVTKPFSPKELTLRVRSILRRKKEEEGKEYLRIGGIRISFGRHECLVEGQPVELTNKEFDLLAALIEAGGDVVTRDNLLDRFWGHRNDHTSRTLDTHIGRLREKLGFEAFRLETVRGIGFRMVMFEKG